MFSKYCLNLFVLVILLGAWNVASAQDIALETDLVVFEFPEDGRDYQFNIRMANDGGGVLRWQSSIEFQRNHAQQGPRRDDGGDLLAEFQGINNQNQHCSPVAWDWDNDRMWVTSVNPNLAVAYTTGLNYGNIEEVIRIDPGVCTDGAWARGLLYLPEYNTAALNRYDAQGQNVGAIQMPFPIVGLAADDENGWLFLMNANDETISVFTLTDDGGVGDAIGVIRNHRNFHGGAQSFGFEWVAEHNGQLWMLNPNDGTIHQIRVDTERWECQEEIDRFQAFPNGEQLVSAFAHDGENFWAGGFSSNNIRIYDDGIAENAWLFLEPTEGELDQWQDIELYMIAVGADLADGVYRADVHIFSNDPNSPDVVIRVVGTIGELPEIEVVWPSVAGFPRVIDFNYNREVWTDYPVMVPVTIRNLGGDDLVVTEVVTHTEFFTPNLIEFTIAPGDSQEVEVTYLNASEGTIRDSLFIRSNDVDVEYWKMRMVAQAFSPPEIHVNAQDVEVRLREGQSRDIPITVNNTGGWVLSWTAAIGPREAPGRDEPAAIIATVTPSEGILRPASAVNLGVHLELTALEPEPEDILLTITSNDPANPAVEVLFHVTSLGVGEAESSLPSVVCLDAIHPNPFNSTSTVEFTLPVRSEVQLALLDMEGRQVLDLAKGEFEAGSHQFVIDAGQLPAGCYLVRLKTAREVRFAKAVVMK